MNNAKITPPDEIWIMRDGTRIAVGDMEESHVRNALRLMLRNERRRQERKAPHNRKERYSALDGVRSERDIEAFYGD
jgi:ABC-type sugar transport system ATPase subunit